MPTFFTGSKTLVRATTSSTVHLIATATNAAGAVNLRNDATTHAFAILDNASGSLPNRRVVIPPGKIVKLARGVQETALIVNNASVLATPGYLRKNDKFREYINLSGADALIRRAESITGNKYTRKFAFDTTDMSMVFKSHDTGDDYIGDMNGIWRYSAPSTKYILNKQRFFEASNALSQSYYYDNTLLGILAEGARTNLAPMSANFNNILASPSWLGITGFSAITPVKSIFQGELAYRHTADGSANRNRNQQVTLANSTNYNVSFLVENVNAVTTQFGLFDETSQDWQGLGTYTWATNLISTASGTLVNSNVENFGVGPNGGKLVRISLTTTSDAINTAHSIRIYPGSAGANSFTVIIHHGQLEAGIFPSSPIVTTTAAVARAIDNIQLLLNSNSFDREVGTLYVEGYDFRENLADLVNYDILTVCAADGVDKIRIGRFNDSVLSVVNDGTSNFFPAGASNWFDGSNSYRFALAYAQNDCQCAMFGTAFATLGVVNVMAESPSSVAIGSTLGTGALGYLYVKKGLWVPERLSQTELELLTSRQWD